MGAFTHYLTVREDISPKIRVTIEPDSPLSAIADALEGSSDLRYSPILPAYLIEGERPETPPRIPSLIAFYFAPKPYQSLGKIRPGLSRSERDSVFFTEGLASIVLVDGNRDRVAALKEEIGCGQVEIWELVNGLLSPENVRVLGEPTPPPEGLSFGLTAMQDSVIDVYVEQISASIASLWAAYAIYVPEEKRTLIRMLEAAKGLVEQYARLKGKTADLTGLKQQNAIISALVELSASLSYSVTQGTSGSCPILNNRSPFPHHSLLGVGGAVRAVTKFIRYLECALSHRSAAEVIEKQYSTKRVHVPPNISTYESSANYSFRPPHELTEEFDCGGKFPTDEDVPLLAHFSLRHGYKEAKFSITAASESLSAECLPAWTLMTLSHEIMHSRVRDIFQALFGVTWEHDDWTERWETFHREFQDWYEPAEPSEPPIYIQGIRNAILNFCLSMWIESKEEPRDISLPEDIHLVTREDLLDAFRKHKRLAVELFVHFHDYYFAYACQPKPYVMSLWASWTTVAAPVEYPMEYLVRTLATIACGTGSNSRAAFEGAAERLQEGLEHLESAGIRSPLFDELRSQLRDKDRAEAAFILFKPAYYLMDLIRQAFASREIASRINRLEQDPFADGSTVASDYSSSIYVFGEQDDSLLVSPIRYSLAALVRQLSGEPQIADVQWLTAWNSIVISSQEVPYDKT
jgi:hypothetical protein